MALGLRCPPSHAPLVRPARRRAAVLDEAQHGHGGQSNGAATPTAAAHISGFAHGGGLARSASATPDTGRLRSVPLDAFAAGGHCGGGEFGSDASCGCTPSDTPPLAHHHHHPHAAQQPHLYHSYSMQPAAHPHAQPHGGLAPLPPFPPGGGGGAGAANGNGGGMHPTASAPGPLAAQAGMRAGPSGRDRGGSGQSGGLVSGGSLMPLGGASMSMASPGGYGSGPGGSEAGRFMTDLLSATESPMPLDRYKVRGRSWHGGAAAKSQRRPSQGPARAGRTR
jgi:hypothetical protein